MHAPTLLFVLYCLCCQKLILTLSPPSQKSRVSYISGAWLYKFVDVMSFSDTLQDLSTVQTSTRKVMPYTTITMTSLLVDNSLILMDTYYCKLRTQF